MLHAFSWHDKTSNRSSILRLEAFFNIFFRSAFKHSGFYIFSRPGLWFRNYSGQSTLIILFPLLAISALTDELGGDIGYHCNQNGQRRNNRQHTFNPNCTFHRKHPFQVPCRNPAVPSPSVVIVIISELFPEVKEGILTIPRNPYDPLSGSPCVPGIPQASWIHIF